MLTIVQSANTGAAINYYKHGLMQADYYSSLSTPSYWSGKGAARLNLNGEVNYNDFKNLVQNQHPAANDNNLPVNVIKLKPRFNRNNRVGYDATVSVSKSVSMAWALSDDESVKQDIMNAFIAANNKMLAKMESMMQTRVNENGTTRDEITGNMIASTFIHTHARPVNGISMPQLHAHNFIQNMTWVEEKQRHHAAQLGLIKKNAPYLQAYFHNEFANNLIDKGFAITRTKHGFELAGISREGIMAFSERTKQIEDYANSHNITDVKEKAGLAARIRENKGRQLSNQALEAHYDTILPPSDRIAIDRLRNGSASTEFISAEQALAHAMEHEFARQSVVDQNRLMATALYYGMGTVNEADIHAKFREAGILTRQEKAGRTFVTTRNIWREEQDIIDFVKNGRGKYAPVTRKDYEIPDYFNDGQVQAAKHLWGSSDRVMVARGLAGTGKTTVMKVVDSGIKADGKEMMALAPTGAASEMHREEGFENTHTLQLFMRSKRLQQEAAGKIVWVDEAGMVSTKQMRELFKIAEERNFRIMLTGDERQHHAVERGDALRLITEKAGIPVVELDDIIRQKPEWYNIAARYFSKGEVEKGMNVLDKMGAIREIDKDAPTKAEVEATTPDWRPEWLQNLEEQAKAGNASPFSTVSKFAYSRPLMGTMHEQMAQDYLRSRMRGENILVIAPTHKEKDAITKEIRSELKRAGRIVGEEHTFTIQRNLHYTKAEKSDVSKYESGQRIQIMKDIRGGIRKGEKYTIDAVTTDKQLVIRDEAGNRRTLSLEHAGHFNVYATKNIALAKGDKVRIIQGGTVYFSTGRARLNDGTIHDIRGFNENGDIVTRNGLIIPRTYANLDYGFVQTSHASQGRTVDRVIAGMSSSSFGEATNLEQIYTTITRGRESVGVYTDNKKRLLKEIEKSSQRELATDVIKDNNSFWQRNWEEERKRIQRFHQMAAQKEPRSHDNDRGR